MKKKSIGLGIGSGLLLVCLMLGSCAFFKSGTTTVVAMTAYGETFHGLNHDMRETLHKIREGHNVSGNVEIMHDQLHLMKKTLHLVKKGNEQDPHFQKLHDLNHNMREAWHKVKKDHDREGNLRLLHDQLHEMKETLYAVKGESGLHEGR